MLRILLERWKQGARTDAFPAADPRLPDRPCRDPRYEVAHGASSVTSSRYARRRASPSVSTSDSVQP